jgi:hypothetical protein
MSFDHAFILIMTTILAIGSIALWFTVWRKP